MTISKSTAEQIAKKLCQKKLNEYIKAKDNLSQTIEKTYLKKVPKDIMTFFNKQPKLVNTTSSICLHGDGFRYYHTNFSRRYPNLTIIMDNVFTQSEMGTFFKLHDIEQKLEKEYKDLLRQVETALINLKTTKRISENFPEAIPFLPTTEKFELAINITDIRKQLK